jgi:hypothetical protein
MRESVSCSGWNTRRLLFRQQKAAKFAIALDSVEHFELLISSKAASWGCSRLDHTCTGQLSQVGQLPTEAGVEHRYLADAPGSTSTGAMLDKGWPRTDIPWLKRAGYDRDTRVLDQQGREQAGRKELFRAPHNGAGEKVELHCEPNPETS